MYTGPTSLLVHGWQWLGAPRPPIQEIRMPASPGALRMPGLAGTDTGRSRNSVRHITTRIALLLTTGGLAAGCGTASTSSTPARTSVATATATSLASPITTTTPAAWQTYKHHQFGFQLDVPTAYFEEWQSQTSTVSSTIFRGQGDGTEPSSYGPIALDGQLSIDARTSGTCPSTSDGGAVPVGSGITGYQGGTLLGTPEPAGAGGAKDIVVVLYS